METVVMIWVFTIWKKYAASLGKKISIIYRLIDLKRKIEEDIVFVKKAKHL